MRQQDRKAQMNTNIAPILVAGTLMASSGTPHGQQTSSISLQLAGGQLAGQKLDAHAARIVINPDAPIEGQVTLTVRNDMHPNAIAPLAATSTWGEPERSVWEIELWVRTGTSSHEAPVRVTAPEIPGTYYLVFALAGTYNVAQIMSGTHPGWRADWTKGNILAKQTSRVFQEAMTQGWVPFAWYSPEGPKNGTMAMTAVEVVVKRMAATPEVKQGPQSTRVLALRCLNCGKLNELYSTFCQGCGARLVAKDPRMGGRLEHGNDQDRICRVVFKPGLFCS
jgi:hypothetical protein